MLKTIPNPAESPVLTADRSRILTMGDLVGITTLSRSTILRMAKSGQFPKPIKIGVTRIGWSEADVTAWIAARRAAA